MKVSINQIELTIAKAAWGSGWPYGLAEDCGQAAAWLAARGFDGVGIALGAIDTGPVAPTVHETPEALVFEAAQAARVAPSAFDLLAANVGVKRVVLRATDQPLLVIGFAGIAAKLTGNSYRLTFTSGCHAIVAGSAVTAIGDLPASVGIDVQIECGARRRDAAAEDAIDIEIDDDLWHDALMIAARSYVPSSKGSREFGAGAGLTDDD